MSYISSKTRVSSLTIGGVDYTSAFEEFLVSDASAYKNGCIQTTGTLTVGKYSGGPLVEDYDRDNFKRGTIVLLDLTEPGGSSYRHPRGYLYVISSSYDVETEKLVVELGCRLSLMALTEEIAELAALVPVPLDIAQTSFSNCAASFASVGQYVYQKNNGTLATGEFFQGDGLSGVAPGDWVSVLGVTSLAVNPLAGAGAIPDGISLSYQVPLDGQAVDNKGLIENVDTSSYYFTNYPATVYVRKNSNATAANPNGTLNNVGNTSTSSPTGGNASPCGNTAPPPQGSTQPPSCNAGYELTSQAMYMPALRRDSRVTYYDGPGAQVSRVTSAIYGPAVEANGQYYADKFAYCRSVYATQCNPNGSCPFEGMEEILLARGELINYYGSANELVKTIQDSYSPTLSAAQPSDWRSGINNGIPQQFNQNLSTTSVFRSSRVETYFYQEGNANVQKIMTWASTASRGVGLGGNIDALSGIKSVVIRRSSSNTTVDVTPDIANSATTTTEEKTSSIVLFTGRYKNVPLEAGPYILEEQIPVPLLFNSPSQISAAVSSYENYLSRFVKGDVFGLQIAEPMRTEVVDNWRPGMPFRYSDPGQGKVIAMRMDATSWGVSRTESVFVTNGVWIGFSDGVVSIPSNVMGDSRPDMGSGTQPPSAIVPPSVDDETSVDSGAFTFEVDVSISLSSLVITYGNDGVLPPPYSGDSVDVYKTFVVYVSGLVVAPGDLVSTGPGGSIPVDAAGSLVVANATVIVDDLFA